MNTTQRRFDWILGSLSVDALCLDIDDFSEVQHLLNTTGYQTLTSDLAGTSSAMELFRNIVNTLSTNPDYLLLHADINAAALEDSLWGGLAGPDDLALVLLHAEVLINEHLNILFLIHETVNYVVTSQRLKYKTEKKVKILVFGRGPNFVRLRYADDAIYIEQ